MQDLHDNNHVAYSKVIDLNILIVNFLPKTYVKIIFENE